METRKSQKALVIVTGGPGTGSYKDQRSDSRTDNDFLRRD